MGLRDRLRPVIERAKELNDTKMIQRIIDTTDIDERLEAAYKIENNIPTVSPETRDKMRITKLSRDLAPEEFDDNVLRKILGHPLSTDFDGKTMLTSEHGQYVPPRNLQVTRNSQGYILSSDSEEENLLDVTLTDKMIQRKIFNNVVDTNFEQLELPFETLNEIEMLEAQVRQLEEEKAELEGQQEELLTDRDDLSHDVEVKQEQIDALNETIDSLNDRFSVTPTEGTFFSIPPKFPDREKEDLDYWVIEDGKRRRIKNYAMVQVMLDQRDKTINDIQKIEIPNIVKMERGDDVLTEEVTDWWQTRLAIDNNIYVPDQVLQGGKFKVFYEEQEPINDNISFARMLKWMWIIGKDWGGTSPPELSTIKYSLKRDVRYWVALAALWQIWRELNPEEVAKQEEERAELIANAIAQVARLRQIVTFMRTGLDGVNAFAVNTVAESIASYSSTYQKLDRLKQNLENGGNTYQNNSIGGWYLNEMIKLWPEGRNSNGEYLITGYKELHNTNGIFYH